MAGDEVTVYCANGCHVYLTGPSTGSGRCSARCTCGQAANGYTPVSVMMYGHPMNYNPYGPHAPKQASATDVPLLQFKAAQEAGATHLSGDGKRIYCERFGATLEAEWQGGAYGSWWACEGLPGDAVRIE